MHNNLDEHDVLFSESFDSTCAQYKIPVDTALKIKSLWKRTFVPAKTILFESGNVFDEVWFVADGAVKSSRLIGDAEWTYTLTVRNQYIVDFKSYVTCEPSILTFQTILDMVFFRISRKDLDVLCAEDPHANDYGSFLAEYSTAFVMQRILDLQCMTLKERYQALEARYPDVTKLIPQQDIASYIGAQPESLSRVKGKAKGG